MVSHSDDGGGQSDPRITYVKAMDHAPGSMRPIWPDIEDWPRFVGDARGSTYRVLPGQEPTSLIGFIPQVAHTYAYCESLALTELRRAAAPPRRRAAGRRASPNHEITHSIRARRRRWKLRHTE
jgi:hypothetical protein